EVDRRRRRAFALHQSGSVGFNPLNEFWIGRSQIGATGACGVISATPCGRWSTVKIAVTGKILANQLGTDDFAVLFDQAAIGAGWKDRLGDTCHAKRIEQTCYDGKRYDHDKCWTKLFQHFCKSL